MSLGVDHPAHTHDGPENVVGALIFFGYIMAAIFFTSIIIKDLVVRTSAPSTDPKHNSASPSLNGKVQIFALLSLVSFSVLSYHMLGFLLRSYFEWATTRNIALQTNFHGMEGAISMFYRHNMVRMWTWATQSTLFRDFAEDILRPSNYWWTAQALIFSMGWNTYMAFEGM